MADTRTDPQYKLRLPADLKARIEAAAEANERSMNAEIIATLSRAYPASTKASELLNELYGFILSLTRNMDGIDRAVVHEFFEDLGRQVYQLEKLAPQASDITTSGEVDAVLTTKDPKTGEEKQFVVEYKNSINNKDFAVQQLRQYLEQNPNFSGGIIIVGDERLKPARLEPPRNSDPIT